MSKRSDGDMQTRRLGPWGLVLVGAVLVSAGIVVSLASRPESIEDYRARVDVGVIPIAQAAQPIRASRTRVTSLAAAKPPKPGEPVRLRIPSVQIDAPVVPTTYIEGTMNVPSIAQTVGWWVEGGMPGARQGTVVVVGHVDSAIWGKGAFYPLRDVPLEALVRIETTEGLVSYKVVARRSFDKQELPVDDLFTAEGQPMLVMITCGGAWSKRTGYEDNTVVYAIPTQS